MAGEVTIARLLGDAGYITGMTGKWHLGEDEGQWPTDVGFDEYFGNLSANTSYHDFRDPEISPELFYNPERAAAMERVHFIRSARRRWSACTSSAPPSGGGKTAAASMAKKSTWRQNRCSRGNQSD